LVAATGLEPVLPKIGKQILSLLCLPFHHAVGARNEPTGVMSGSPAPTRREFITLPGSTAAA
jgi:hypothetical protein